MNAAELKRHLTAIVTEEEHGSPDWERVTTMCLDLSRRLSLDACDECPHDVHHFIADFDIRKSDEKYGQKQRADVRAYLEP